MSVTLSHEISEAELSSLKMKLEKHLARSLSPEEIEAFKSAINLDGVQRREKAPQLFNKQAIDLGCLEDAISNIVSQAEKQNSPEWTYSVWTYHF